MAAKEKVVKRVVVHPKLYMRVDGKVQLVPKGTEVTVTKEQCKALGGKLMDPAEQKKLDTTVEGGRVVEGSSEETEALKGLAAELDTAQKEAADAKAEAAKATEALTAIAAQLDTAQKEVKALKAAAKK